MFQRRLLIVAGQLRNAQLAQPLLGRRTPEDRPASEPQLEGDEFVDGEDGGRRAPVSFQSLRLTLTKKRWHNEVLYLSLILYVVAGILFYCLDAGNRLSGIVGFYQAISIGYSVGLSPMDPEYSPNPWFSSIYILVGAALIAIILTAAGQQVEERASSNMFEAMKRREDYEAKMAKDNPFCTRLKAYVGYNAAYLLVILLWIVWLVLIIGWSLYSTSTMSEEEERWKFREAQYFAISLCSSAGSMSLPPHSPEWAYLLAAISMLIGVPLMALAVSSIVVMSWQATKFRKVKLAAWSPITTAELDGLDGLGLGAMGGDDGYVMTKGGFVLLGLLRMGQDAGIIHYLSDAYDEMDRRGGVFVRDSAGGTNNCYSDQASIYLERNSTDRETSSDVISDEGRGDGRSVGERWSVTASSENTTRHLSNVNASLSSTTRTNEETVGRDGMSGDSGSGDQADTGATDDREFSDRK